MDKNVQARCIAHEIRNQISICELYSQIINKHLEKAKFKNDSVTNALNCITKSLKIMSNNLLDLKSLDNAEFKTLSACNIIKEAINLSVVYIQEKDINISLSCKNDEKIYVDENKFLACIVNILKNAIEAIEEKGEITITINNEGYNLSIKIANDGPKIPEEVQEHIFDEGYTTKQTGSGLGLPICYQNLKSQNAELKLKKSNEKITEFEIIIPIA